MPADPTDAYSDDRLHRRLVLTASARLNGDCGYLVRIFRRLGTEEVGS